MINTKPLKRTLRDMAFGAVLTAALMSYAAAPHVDWTLHAGNQPDVFAHAKDQAVAVSQLATQDAQQKTKGR